MLGDLLDDRDICPGTQFRAAQRARQQQAEQPALAQRRDDRLRKLATALDLLGRRLELGAEFPGAPEVVDIGRFVVVGVL